MWCAPLTVPDDVQGLRARVLSTVAAQRPFARHYGVDNGTLLILLPDDGVSSGLRVHEFAFPVDHRIWFWVPKYQDVWADFIRVPEHGSECSIGLDRMRQSGK